MILDKFTVVCMLLSNNIQTNDINYDVIEEYITAPVVAFDTSGSPFVLLSDNNISKVIDNKHGYVYANYTTYRAPFTEHSNLYLARTQVQFVPGIVGKNNGNDFYDNVYLKSGYFHIQVCSYLKDFYHGGDIKIIDFWPKSTSFITTFTSAFGYEISAYNELEGEFSLGNGASITTTLGGALSLNFNKSYSTVTDNPVLSAQISSDYEDEIEYSFNLLGDAATIKLVGAVTYHIDTYILFEMNDKMVNSNRDAYTKMTEFSFINQYPVMLWWSETDRYVETQYVGSFHG